MNLISMEHRVSSLERPITGGIDPLVLAMETLNDTEMGLLEEYMSLLRSGFPLEQISEMMGPESYQQALAITDKVETELRFRQYSEPEYKTGNKAGKKKMVRPRKDKAGARDVCPA